MVPWPTHLVHDADDQLASHAGISAAATRGVRSPRGVVCVGRDGTDENDKMSSWRGQYFIFSDAPLQKSSSKARATDLRGARAASATPRTTRAPSHAPHAVCPVSKRAAHQLTR